LANFRQVDIAFLVDFTIYNVLHAVKNIKMPPNVAKVFLNIMWAVLRNNDAKYTPWQEPEIADDQCWSE
jgi:hypothetical protein